MYTKIYNPKTGRFVNTNGILGKYIIKNYLNNLIGGAVAGTAVAGTDEISISEEELNSKWWINRLFNYYFNNDTKEVERRPSPYMIKYKEGEYKGRYAFINIDEILPKMYFNTQKRINEDTNFNYLLENNQFDKVEKLIHSFNSDNFKKISDWKKICRAKYLMYKDYCARPFNNHNKDREVAKGKNEVLARQEIIFNGQPVDTGCYDFDCIEFSKNDGVTKSDLQNISTGCAICATLREIHTNNGCSKFNTEGSDESHGECIYRATRISQECTQAIELEITELHKQIKKIGKKIATIDKNLLKYQNFLKTKKDKPNKDQMENLLKFYDIEQEAYHESYFELITTKEELEKRKAQLTALVPRPTR